MDYTINNGEFYKIGENYGKLLQGNILTTNQEIEFISKKEYYENVNEVEEVKQIPQEISPRQFRLALTLSGYDLSQVETILETLEEPQKSLAKISLEYATSFERNFVEVVQFAQMMGISEVQLDEIFILGNTL